MSHIQSIETRVHDPLAVQAACKRLQLPPPVQGTAELFSGSATGLLVQLPNWLYPVVVDTLTGVLRYDNYSGRWGDESCLEKFLQMYSVEKVRLESRKQNYPVTEQALQDGFIKLEIVESA